MALEIKVTNLNGGESEKKIIIEESELLDSDFYAFNLSKHIKVLHNNINIVRHAHYKSISGITGAKRKIRPQKKMGRSRQGSIRELHMRGGAVKFGFSGDKDRDNHLRYRRKLYINKKEKILSQKCVISNKLQNNLVLVLDVNNASIVKTKEALEVLKPIIREDKISSMICNDNTGINAIRNIKALAIFKIDSMNILNMLKYENMIFTLEALTKFLDRLKIKYLISHGS